MREGWQPGGCVINTLSLPLNDSPCRPYQAILVKLYICVLETRVTQLIHSGRVTLQKRSKRK